MVRTTILGVPICTLAKFSGLTLSPGELRRLGLPISLRDLGDVPLPELKIDEGPRDLRNLSHFVRSTELIRESVASLPEDDLAVVMGGECSLVVGNLAGAKEKRRGRAGMLWLDAHGDFNTPVTTPSGYIGGMCLAFACGRGPQLSAAVDGKRPLLTDDALVHFGSKALDPVEEKAMKDSEMTLVSSEEFKGAVEDHARRAARLLAERSDWIALHLDLDVLDPSEMQAVNFLTLGGISIRDVLKVWSALRETGKLWRIEVAGYNPLKDVNHVGGRMLLELLSRAAR